MPLIKNGTFAEDEWVQVADDADMPADGPALISLARWSEEKETLTGRNAPLAVMLDAGDAPEAIADDLDRFAMIAVNFPAYKDGRGFSYASLLRQRYGYEGEIRATGEVLRDQWSLMARCGFDAYDVADGVTLESFNEALGEFTHVYQPASDGRKTVIQLRHGG